MQWWSFTYQLPALPQYSEWWWWLWSDSRIFQREAQDETRCADASQGRHQPGDHDGLWHAVGGDDDDDGEIEQRLDSLISTILAKENQKDIKRVFPNKCQPLVRRGREASAGEEAQERARVSFAARRLTAAPGQWR